MYQKNHGIYSIRYYLWFPLAGLEQMDPLRIKETAILSVGKTGRLIWWLRRERPHLVNDLSFCPKVSGEEAKPGSLSWKGFKEHRNLALPRRKGAKSDWTSWYIVEGQGWWQKGDTEGPQELSRGGKDPYQLTPTFQSVHQLERLTSTLWPHWMWSVLHIPVGRGCFGSCRMLSVLS